MGRPDFLRAARVEPAHRAYGFLPTRYLARPTGSPETPAPRHSQRCLCTGQTDRQEHVKTGPTTGTCQVDHLPTCRTQDALQELWFPLLPQPSGPKKAKSCPSMARVTGWLSSCSQASGGRTASKVGTNDNMQHGQPNRRHSIVTNTDPVDPGHRSCSPHCPHPGPYSPTRNLHPPNTRTSLSSQDPHSLRFRGPSSSD